MILIIDEKSYKNILVYDISHKTLFGSRRFCIRFDEVDGLLKVYDGVRYLALFGSGKDDGIYNRIRSYKSKSGSAYVSSHYYAKVKTDFYNSLPLENTLTFCNIIILIKSVLNKDKNHY